jgi:MoaA/NifB/PqqE/SkfB family radical SAM enzyme
MRELRKTIPIFNNGEILPENNVFKIVYIDLSHRCNMECANCYLPNRDFPDIDTEKLLKTIEKFPYRTELRFIGGEPTLHKDLPKIIRKVSNMKFKHRVVLVTNGLRLSNENYVKKLVEAGLKTVYLSFNGADDDSIYQILDNMKCAKKKMAAFKNCVKYNIKMALGCIIVKGINESVLTRIKQILQEHQYYVSLEVRNVGHIGRYLGKDENYSRKELLFLLSKVFEFDISNEEWKNSVIEDDSYSCYFPLQPDRARLCKTTGIRVTDWSKMNQGYSAEDNLKRGRLTQNFSLAPFFEHLKENENGY